MTYSVEHCGQIGGFKKLLRSFDRLLRARLHGHDNQALARYVPTGNTAEIVGFRTAFAVAVCCCKLKIRRSLSNYVPVVCYLVPAYEQSLRPLHQDHVLHEYLLSQAV